MSRQSDTGFPFFNYDRRGRLIYLTGSYKVGTVNASKFPQTRQAYRSLETEQMVEKREPGFVVRADALYFIWTQHPTPGRSWVELGRLTHGGARDLCGGYNCTSSTVRANRLVKQDNRSGNEHGQSPRAT